MMFKAVLLLQWHSLSDPKLAEALYVRIDFLDFCGIGLSTQSTLTQSTDSDATWVKSNNNNKSTFVYRCFFAVDDNSDFIQGLYGTPANVSQFHSFAPTLAAADFKPKRVYADKGLAARKITNT